MDEGGGAEPRIEAFRRFVADPRVVEGFEDTPAYLWIPRLKIYHRHDPLEALAALGVSISDVALTGIDGDDHLRVTAGKAHANSLRDEKGGATANVVAYAASRGGPSHHVDVRAGVPHLVQLKTAGGLPVVTELHFEAGEDPGPRQ